jgi:hypothetical protein
MMAITHTSSPRPLSLRRLTDRIALFLAYHGIKWTGIELIPCTAGICPTNLLPISMMKLRIHVSKEQLALEASRALQADDAPKEWGLEDVITIEFVMDQAWEVSY